MNHICGDPNSPCDIICMEEANKKRKTPPENKLVAVRYIDNWDGEHEMITCLVKATKYKFRE